MKRRIISAWLACLLVLGMVLPSVSAADLHFSAEVEISAQYDEAGAFRDGYAAVKQNGKWGLIDESGELCAPFVYDWMGSQNEGVVLAGKLVDANTCRLYLISAHSGAARKLTYAFFDGETEIDMTATLQMLSTYGHNYVCYDGVINVRGIAYTKTGEQIRPKDLAAALGSDGFTHYSMSAPSVDGVIPMTAHVQGSDGALTDQCFYMNAEGEIIRVFDAAIPGSDARPSCVYAPRDGLIVVKSADADPSTGAVTYRYGLMAETGEWIVLPTYADCRWNLDGTFFHDGLWVVVADGKYGAVNTKGEAVISFAYDFMGTFSFGLSAVSQDGEMFYIDRTGKRYTVQNPDGEIAELGAASAFSEEGIACVYDRRSEKAYCLIASPQDGVLPVVEGSETVEWTVYFPEYSTETSTLGLTYDPAGLLAFREAGKWGYLRIGAVRNFTDVADDAYYADAVRWALRKEVTNGTSETTFSPESDCTRAQIITFLWRASGAPVPSRADNPFRDVADGQYYTDAVLWALEKGILDEGDLFRPNEPCTRAQTVIYMWRCAGSPEQTAVVSFSDVTLGTETASAVNWALAQGVTNGTSATTFSPYRVCSRGQIVTFLWRAYGK